MLYDVSFGQMWDEGSLVEKDYHDKALQQEGMVMAMELNKGVWWTTIVDNGQH